MEETKRNAPIDIIRNGSLKASIWKNPKDDGSGSFLSVTFARTFKDADGNLRDSSSFSGRDLLVIAELARQSYNTVSNFSSVDLEKTI